MWYRSIVPIGENWSVSGPVLLLHGYDSKPSALGDLADRLGSHAELVAGFEDIGHESFAWWLGDLSEEARQDGTEYLDEISVEASRALRSTSGAAGATGALGTPGTSGLASLLEAKNSKDASDRGIDPFPALVSVVGFSQGAAAALTWLLDPLRQTTVATVVAVAGFLPDLVEAQLRDLKSAGSNDNLDSSMPNTMPSTMLSAHIHMVHLSDDEIVDALVSKRASRQLRSAGFIVTEHHVDGTHAWSAELTDFTVQLLRSEAKQQKVTLLKEEA